MKKTAHIAQIDADENKLEDEPHNGKMSRQLKVRRLLVAHPLKHFRSLRARTPACSRPNRS